MRQGQVQSQKEGGEEGITSSRDGQWGPGWFGVGTSVAGGVLLLACSPSLHSGPSLWCWAVFSGSWTIPAKLYLGSVEGGACGVAPGKSDKEHGER